MSKKNDKEVKAPVKDKASRKVAKESKDTKKGKQKTSDGATTENLEELEVIAVTVSETTATETPAQAYLAKMQAERGYILGWHKILAERDFDFLQGYNGLLEAAYTNPRLLDAKTKEMIITAVLIAVRSLPDHIKTHLELCKKLGVTEQEMLEVLELVLPPAGVPAFMHSFDLWKQVYNVE